MDYLYDRCVGEKSVLVEPRQIQEYLEPKDELTFKEIEIAVKSLMVDGYVEVIYSDNKGKLNYVISLKTRGEGYLREKKDARDRKVRSFGWKLFVGLAVMVMVWMVGRLIGIR